MEVFLSASPARTWLPLMPLADTFPTLPAARMLEPTSAPPTFTLFTDAASTSAPKLLFTVREPKSGAEIRSACPSSVHVLALIDLMTESLSSFASLFAPVLLLHGHQPPVLKRDIVRATVKLLGLDAAPFERVFELREGGRTLEDVAANELFAAYMAEVERVIEATDRVSV